MAGKFIVIDGTDGSGKTTQLEILAEYLRGQGHQIETVDFPQYNTKAAGLVEEYLSGKYGSAQEVGPYRASIFYAADRYDASFKIKTWLNEGKIILANRYVSSNMGHQGGKILDSAERTKFFEWLYDLEYNLFVVPKPDASLILHVEAEIAQQLALKREREDWQGKIKDIHEADLNHLKQAEKAYLEISKMPGFTLIECTENGNILDRPTIAKKIWQEVEKILF
ncbi:MAG: thymidylate kinase [Patescibacteria group bacterium]|nr:thymidylate kinase [Patescibacteria group bacterium]